MERKRSFQFRAKRLLIRLTCTRTRLHSWCLRGECISTQHFHFGSLDDVLSLCLIRTTSSLDSRGLNLTRDIASISLDPAVRYVRRGRNANKTVRS